MSASEVRSILLSLGVEPARSLGQNFLVNPEKAARIASEAGPGSVLEVGPGLGALTGLLLERGLAVTAVEISPAFCRYLEERFSGSGLSVVQGDFLRTDPSKLPGFPFSSVAGNLPYSISSPALVRLAEPVFEGVGRAVLMLQSEVAVRAAAREGTKDFGRLALALWPHYTVRPILDAGPSEFYPQPAVKSRVILLERRPLVLVPAPLLARYGRVVRISFSSRRKTILNNLASVLGREKAGEVLLTAGVDPALRAEQVPPEGFVRIAGAFPE
jgi:16S rRNA (adenine1518-N6/adenine1519-N6)-dimethyltransferase